MNPQIIDTIKIVLTTFICSSLIMPVMKQIAKHIGAIDMPRSEEGNRHIHKRPIPKLGGVGIFLAFLFGYMFFGKESVQMNSILIGSFIIILTGIADDIKSLRARTKLLGQILAASILVFYGGFLLNNITAFGYTINFSYFSYPLTIIFIVACINIINLIDGLDGLSGGISSIFFLTIGIIGFFQGRSGTLVMLLTFIMLGATLGFLLHNFYPAKIFCGDCAMYLGFMIAVITLLEFKGPALTSLFVPLMILGIPILDTLFAIIRRLLKHQAPFSPDKEHIHHQLLGMNFTQRTTVLIIYGFNLLFAFASIFYSLKDPLMGKILYIIIFVVVVWFVLRTTVISKKNKEITDNIIEKVGGKIKKEPPISIKKKNKKNRVK